LGEMDDPATPIHVEGADHVREGFARKVALQSRLLRSR